MNKHILLPIAALAITFALLIGYSNDDEKLVLSKFIPNEDYKVTFNGSDLSNELLFLSGNGTSYYTIGVNGKGYYIEQYEVIDNELCFTNKIDIENIETIKSLDDVTSLLDTDIMNGNKVVVLRENASDLDSSKIVEKGTDLKLTSIQLKGDYIKVCETKSSADGDTITYTYYSQGVGVVKYEVVFDGVIMDFSQLVSYEPINMQ